MLSAILLASAAAAPFDRHDPSHEGEIRPLGCAVCVQLPAYDERLHLVASIGNPLQQDSIALPDNPREPHLRNVRQLTFGGQNAEAYWSIDGARLTFQTRQPQWPDEQIMTMNADGSGKRLISTGLGRTTCSYFTPDQKWIYFSSTHDVNPGAQQALDMREGYVWMVNPQFSLWRARPDGSELTQIKKLPGYVAETTIDPSGRYMTWTSDYEGDLEIYRSDLNGRNIRRLTSEFGYDGGPFVSWDGKKIVYRRDNLRTDEQRREYSDLLKRHKVRPSRLDIWIMDADGRNKRQVTRLDVASFAPFLHPDGKRIIFSSNFGSKNGREFELWMVNVDGTGLKRITSSPEFDGFPMFSRDGKKIVWASNRNGSVRGETNIFVADWVE